MGVYTDKGQIWWGYIRGVNGGGAYIQEEKHFSFPSKSKVITFLFFQIL